MKKIYSGISAILLIATLNINAQNNSPKVSVTDNGSSFNMTNGYLTVKIDQRSGDLTSLKTPNTITPDIELMGYVSGHHAGYWEQSTSLAPRRTTGISIDPANNNGEIA